MRVRTGARPRVALRLLSRTALLLPAFAFAFALLAACGGQELAPKTAPPPAPRSDPGPLQRIAEACARVASCMQLQDVARLRDPSACVEGWLAHGSAQAPDPLQKCLLQAATCDQVTACIRGGGDARAASFCTQRAGVVSGCDGERLVSCGDDESPESTVLDCAAIGASCREAKAPGGIVIRACFAPAKCPAGAAGARCDGAEAVLGCHDGAIERTLCGPGTRCEEHRDDDGDATASCQLAGGRRCGLRGARQCEGDRLVECSGVNHNGKLRVSDCAGFGLKCTGTGPRSGCYVPAETVECDKDMLPRCDEKREALVFCAAGRLTKIACASLGLAACAPNARGAVAACSPPSK